MEKKGRVRVLFRSPKKCAGCKALANEGGAFVCKLGFVLKPGQLAPAPDGRCYNPKTEEAFTKAEALIQRFYCAEEGPDTAFKEE